MRRVAITGVGAITPVGNDAKATWDALLAGKSGIDTIATFDPSDFPVRIAGEVKGFEVTDLIPHRQARQVDKAIIYSLAAAKEALEDSGLTNFEADRVGVVVGCCVGGINQTIDQYQVLQERGWSRLSPFFLANFLPDSASGYIAIELGLKGPNCAVNSACASGSHSIAEGAHLIRSGQADAVLAGGTEGAINPLVLGGFCAMRGLAVNNEEPSRASRPFDLNRNGFVMAEGAAILCLEELEQAQARGATIYAEVVGAGSSNDAYNMITPDPEAEGVAAMMSRAIADADIEPDDVDYLNAHGTGDAARRLRRDEGDQARLRRARLQAPDLLDQVDGRPPLRRRGRARGDGLRPRDPPRDRPADDQPGRPRPGLRPRLHPARGAQARHRLRALERDGPRRPQRVRSAGPRLGRGLDSAKPSVLPRHGRIFVSH